MERYLHQPFSVLQFAGTGWIGQEGERKRQEVELQRKLDPDYDPGRPTPPPKGEKYVFIGIGVGLGVGAIVGLLLGLNVDLLHPIFWLIIFAVLGAIAGGNIGNYYKKRPANKQSPGSRR